jgi:hypothetical protein
MLVLAICCMSLFIVGIDITEVIGSDRSPLRVVVGHSEPAANSVT